MSKFKLGDRVENIKGFNNYGTYVNKGVGGTVIVIDGNQICVEFDKHINGHDGSGCYGSRLRKGRDGHCKWFLVQDGYVEKVKEKSNESIVIYRKGQEVIAVDKSTGETAVAKCSPQDTFDFKVGAKLAFERLMYTPKIVKQDRYKVGDKVKIVDKWLPGCFQNSQGEMDKWLGKIMTIKKDTWLGYLMVEDASEASGRGWYWNNYCIEGKVVEESEPKKVEEPVESFPNGTIVRLKEEFLGVPKGCLGKVVDKCHDGDYVIDFGFQYPRCHHCDMFSSVRLPEPTGLYVSSKYFEKVK